MGGWGDPKMASGIRFLWQAEDILITVPSRNIVDLSFPTLVFLVRLSLKFYFINLKDSVTMFQG